MHSIEEQAWFDQYNQGPAGANQVPAVALRNTGERTTRSDLYVTSGLAVAVGATGAFFFGKSLGHIIENEALPEDAVRATLGFAALIGSIVTLTRVWQEHNNRDMLDEVFSGLPNSIPTIQSNIQF